MDDEFTFARMALMVLPEKSIAFADSLVTKRSRRERRKIPRRSLDRVIIGGTEGEDVEEERLY